MADKSSGAKPVRISDVAKPGKTAPSASSKPIIVTNRPVLRDPMTVENTSGDKASSTTLPLSHLKIAPLSDEAKSQLTDDKAAADTKTEKAADNAEPAPEPASADPETDSKPEPEAATESAPAETATTDEPDKESDLTTDDEPTKPVPSNQKAEADQAAADQRAKELEDLVESRKFYLPINQVEKRRAKRYAWAGILLIILLAVAWADIAADAGIITIPGVKPLTHFFSN